MSCESVKTSLAKAESRLAAANKDYKANGGGKGRKRRWRKARRDVDRARDDLRKCERIAGKVEVKKAKGKSKKNKKGGGGGGAAVLETAAKAVGAVLAPDKPKRPKFDPVHPPRPSGGLASWALPAAVGAGVLGYIATSSGER